MKHLFTFLTFLICIQISWSQVGLNFEGTSSTVGDRINTTFVGPSGTAARTIEFWAKTSVVGGSSVIQYDIANFGGSVATNARLSIKIQVPINSPSAFIRIESGGTGSFNGTIPVNGGAWHHCAVTYDPLATPQAQIYVDGIADVGGNISLATGTTAMCIGARSGGTFFFNGDLDELRIWSVARTQAEIIANKDFELCGTLPSSLKAYYKFNEGVPSTNNTAISNTSIVNLVGATTNTMNGFIKNGAISNWVTGVAITTSSSSSISVSGCSSYTSPSGSVYTNSGTYTDIIPNAAGCDSTITINFTTLATTATQIVTACDSYTWPLSGATYTSSGSHVFTIVGGNSNSCDSIVTLNLTINTINNGVTDNSNGTATATETGAAYQWLDCNNSNAIISGATSQIFIAPITGNYSVQLTKNGCIDTSACILITSTAYLNPAMNFDGVNDYVQTTTTGVSANGTRTVEAWIKVPVANTTTQHVIADWGSTTVGSRFTTNILNQILRLEVNGASVSGTTLLNDGIWHHIATTYNPSDNDTVRLYVDGIEEAKLRITTINTVSASIKIGARFDNTMYFRGDLDEVKIWNIAKTSTEIIAGMNVPTCTSSSNIISYFDFNQGVPFGNNAAITTLKDKGAFSQTSTPQGLALTGSNSNFSIGPNIAAGSQLTATSTTACGSYTWAQTGLTYTTSGIYTQILAGTNLCDSVVALNLTIHPFPVNTITFNGVATLTANQGAGATYQWLDCNNLLTPIASATTQSFNPNVDGTYAVQISLNGCIDSSICTVFTAIPPPSAPASLKFDGSTTTTLADFIATQYQGISGSGARTIEMWINRGSTVSTQNILMEMGSGVIDGGRFTFKIQNNHLRFETGGTLNFLEGTTNISSNVWNHVAVTYDPTLTSNTVKMYLNGNLEIQGDMVNFFTDLTANPMAIGARFGGVGAYNGKIEDLRVWDITRTQVEIQTAMTSELCTLPTSLKAYYKFNDGIPSVSNTYVTSIKDEVTPSSVNTLTHFALTGSVSNFLDPYMNPGASTSSTQTVTECSSYLWSSNATTYNISGYYPVTILNAAGCDNTITLDLTINQPTTSTQVVVECGSYTWAQNGALYTNSGTYNDTIQNAAMCDSIITLNLTINSATTSSLNVTDCNSYTWVQNGQTYLTGGAFNDTIQNAAGCDSIITLNLILNNFAPTATNNGDATLTANLAGANYIWINCVTGQAISGATAQTFAPTANGSYAVIVTNTTCSDTTACMTVGNVGIQENSLTNVNIYPNPVSNELTIQFEGTETGELMITNVQGQIVESYGFNNTSTIKTNLEGNAAGVYYVVLKTANTNSTYKIIKK